MQVVVYVRFEHYIPYMVDVENPKNPESIRQALREKDPSDWETEPNFYENLGSNWQHFITKTEDFTPSCPKCGKPVDVVALARDYYILGCMEHREFDKTFSIP